MCCSPRKPVAGVAAGVTVMGPGRGRAGERERREAVVEKNCSSTINTSGKLVGG